MSAHMSDVEALVDEFKSKGNDAYASKRFDEAIALYDKAIETNPNNFVLFNNRSAAYYELKNYAKALEDAEKSISIQDNAKGHARKGATLWALQKLKEARAEFERVVAMDPSNHNARDNVQKLTELLNSPRAAFGANAYAPPRASVFANGVPLPPPCGGEFSSAQTGIIGILTNLIVLIMDVYFILSYILQPKLVFHRWQFLLYAFMAQQGVMIYYKKLIPTSMEGVYNLAQHFCSLAFLLCLAARLINIGPQLFMSIFIFLYTIVDLVNHKMEVARVIGPLYNMLAPLVIKLEAERVNLLLMAATMEAAMLASVILTGGMLFTLVYIQYIKGRYKFDCHVQLAFLGLRREITKLTSASFMPAFVDRYAQKFFDFLHIFSHQSR